jgi:predicted nucleic acid-binding protein
MPTTPVFVDTNVLLYAASTHPAEAEKRDAARKVLADNPICFSVQVAQEFFVNAIRKLTPPLSRADALGFLRAVNPTTVIALDYELFEEATRMQERFQISYWDAAIVTAAKRLVCDTVFSEDLADGQNYAGVRVVNPFKTKATIL